MKQLQPITGIKTSAIFFNPSKRRIILCMLLILSLFLSGCGTSQVREIAVRHADYEFDMTPCKQADGEPFHIGIMDLVPPIESSYLWLKGLVHGLQDAGYISEKVDFSNAPDNFVAFYQYLISQDLGDYIVFDDDFFLVGTSRDKELGERLKKKVQEGQLQIIVSTGTDPGLFLKELDLGIPFLVSLATDPIASGIIDSAEDTGDENIWALVEPNPYFRQFGVYHTMMGFETLGMVVVDEYDIIAGNSEYRRKAQELGVTLRELSVTEEETLSGDYTEVLMEKLKNFDLTGLDGILFAFGSINDEQAPVVSEYLSGKGIPVLIGDGDSLVKNGGLISMSCFDYEGYGYYAAMVMSNILHGQKAGDQPCLYYSAPHIVLNLTTAEKTGFDTDLELLRSTDVIYR